MAIFFALLSWVVLQEVKEQLAPPPAPHPLTPSLPVAATCAPAAIAAGQGSVLSQEVDQLKKMLKTGAGWEVISQMMSYISDKAAQVGGRGGGGRDEGGQGGAGWRHLLRE